MDNKTSNRATPYRQANIAADRTPFADAIAVWHMSDLNDTAGKNSRLILYGDVKIGIELTGAERDASIKRGDDGYLAEFQGDYLGAGQGADGELNFEGKELSLCIRLKDASGKWNTPLFAKHGGSKKLVYNLFSTNLGSGMVLGFELGADWNELPLQVSVPISLIGPTDWHDLIVRYTGSKLELFVDGVLVDESMYVSIIVERLLGDIRDMETGYFSLLKMLMLSSIPLKYVRC